MTTERRVLCSAYKDIARALEDAVAPLHYHSEFDRCFSYLASQVGVQPSELSIVADVETALDGTEKVTNVFLGLPSPDPERRGQIVSYDEALGGDWQSPRRRA